MTQAQKDSGMVLRFDVGDRVACNIGGWASGTIVKVWYRDESWPEDKLAPYQVQLDQGTLIYAPIDDDRAIKAFEGSEAEVEPEPPRAPMTWDEIAAWNTYVQTLPLQPALAPCGWKAWER